jgi:hypothetical protein
MSSSSCLNDKSSQALHLVSTTELERKSAVSQLYYPPFQGLIFSFDRT